MKTLLLVLTLAAASASTGNCGWADTSWGMTVADVQRLHPDARPPSNPKEQDALMIRNFTVAADPYTVRFFFDARGGLKEVTLIRDSKEEVIYRLQIAQQDLKNLLVQKYGQPTSIDEDKLGCMWSTPGLLIRLEYAPTVSHLAVAYLRPDAEALGNL
jgi:hypothetical protein